MSILFSGHDKSVDIFWKFVVLSTPIIGTVLIYFIWLSIYYCLVKIIIIRNKLDIDIIKENYNIFRDSYNLYMSIKNITNQDEFTILLDDRELQRMNINNFVINHEDSMTNISSNSNDSNDSNDSNVENCVICLENINNKISTILDCSHKFHIICLNEWVLKSNSCPLCNGNIIK